MKTEKKRILLSNFIFAFFLTFLLEGCSKSPVEKSRTKAVLGTVSTITLFDKGYDAVYKRIFKRLSDLEALFSVSIVDSDVAKINNAAGLIDKEGNKKWIAVHEDVFFVIKTALYWAKKTQGAFDPSIGSLVSLWGIGGDHPSIPSKEDIKKARILVDYSLIELDEENNAVYLPLKGMKLDLGGIAKGYAADEVVRILKDERLSRAIIDLGGNIYAYGAKQKPSVAWRVGIKNPFDPRGIPSCALSLIDKTVVTSGVYERYFMVDGIRYHHLIDKTTGSPCNNELMSATIITDSSMVADALSTAFFIMGKEKGIIFIDSLLGIEGFCIDRDKKITATSGIRPDITVIDKSFIKK